MSRYGMRAVSRNVGFMKSEIKEKNLTHYTPDLKLYWKRFLSRLCIEVIDGFRWAAVIREEPGNSYYRERYNNVYRTIKFIDNLFEKYKDFLPPEDVKQEIAQTINVAGYLVKRIFSQFGPICVNLSARYHGDTVEYEWVQKIPWKELGWLPRASPFMIPFVLHEKEVGRKTQDQFDWHNVKEPGTGGNIPVLINPVRRRSYKIDSFFYDGTAQTNWSWNDIRCLAKAFMIQHEKDLNPPTLWAPWDPHMIKTLKAIKISPRAMGSFEFHTLEEYFQGKMKNPKIETLRKHAKEYRKRAKDWRDLAKYTKKQFQKYPEAKKHMEGGPKDMMANAQNWERRAQKIEQEINRILKKQSASTLGLANKPDAWKAKYQVQMQKAIRYTRKLLNKAKASLGLPVVEETKKPGKTKKPPSKQQIKNRIQSARQKGKKKPKKGKEKPPTKKGKPEKGIVKAPQVPTVTAKGVSEETKDIITGLALAAGAGAALWWLMSKE